MIDCSEKIYKLSNPNIRKYYLGDIDPQQFANIDRRELLRGNITPESSINIYHYMGGKHPQDVVWTSLIGVIAMHEKVFKLMENNDISGWKKYPVNVYDRYGKLYDDFAGISVTGKSGPLDWSGSQRVQVLTKSKGSSPLYDLIGATIEHEYWDGSDIFMPEGTTYLLATERLVEILKNINVRNIDYVRITEWRISEFTATFKNR